MKIDKKNNYYIMTIFAAITFAFLYNISLEQYSPHHDHTAERIPANMKKARQHVNIDIDYEKLPARNEVRLIGRVNTSLLKTDVLDYKWTLVDNLKLKKGPITGQIDLRHSNEITLDVSIKDMKKKVSVRLEASVRGKKVKIGSVQNFIYDPEVEGKSIDTAAEEKSYSKSMSSQSLSKKELLEKELFKQRKPIIQE